MGYLLDTCLLSEVWKPKPNRGVLEWLGSSREGELFMSVLTLGEIKEGIARLSSGKKKNALERDYALLRSRFSSRVLTVTETVAETWGGLSASATRAGRPLHVVDGLLAATALVSGPAKVTHNGADFAVTPVPVVEPWV